jgi:AraC-like DNA-binding protein
MLPARAVHVGTSDRVRAHATQAWKLVVGVASDLELEVDGRLSRHRAVLVPPYRVQSMSALGTRVAVFVEPGAHGLPFASDRSITTFDAREAHALERTARAIALGRAEDDADAASAILAPVRASVRARQGEARSLDRRVEGALFDLASDTGLAIDVVARRRGLSADRLRHLVQIETGFPLRAHRAWHRTLVAVEAMIVGTTVARAAADAGFSDHAHFTRTFVRFFGRAPSTLPGDVTRIASWATRADTRSRAHWSVVGGFGSRQR